jgi:natural resistance-associated macrophage protein
MSAFSRAMITRAIALGPALAMALYSQQHPAQGDTVNEWLNVLQSVVLPYAILPLVQFVAAEDVMGHKRLRGKSLLGAWALTVFILVVNVALLWPSIKGWIVGKGGSGEGGSESLYADVLAALVVLAYLGSMLPLVVRRRA